MALGDTAKQPALHTSHITSMHFESCLLLRSLLMLCGTHAFLQVIRPSTVQLLRLPCLSVCCSSVFAGGGSKVATLETGATIQVPLFINTGEIIKIDTRTEQYLSRAKE